MKDPWLKFYPGDYLRDPAVRSVCLAARGLWMDMLCLMHQSERPGFLAHRGGQPISHVQLARMVGGDLNEVTRLLQELEDCGVYSRTEDGVIYCRRMVRDTAKREKCSEAGKRGGGNPRLGSKGGEPLKETYKGQGKGGFALNDQKSEVRSQKADTHSEAEASSCGRAGATTEDNSGKAGKKQQPEFPALPTDLAAVVGFAESWNDFRLQRQAIRKPLTAIAARRLLPKLAKRPGDAVAALEMAIENSWQGFEWKWFDNRQATETGPGQSGRAPIKDYLKPDHELVASPF